MNNFLKKHYTKLLAIIMIAFVSIIGFSGHANADLTPNFWAQTANNVLQTNTPGGFSTAAIHVGACYIGPGTGTPCGGGGGGGLDQLTGDVLAGPGTGSQTATVQGIQGFPVSNTTPSSGDTLVYNGSSYIPQAVGGAPIYPSDEIPRGDGITPGGITSGDLEFDDGNANFIAGPGAGSGFTASDSTFIGYQAGNGATSAGASNFIGVSAGEDAPGAGGSNFIGVNAGYHATNATNSIFEGINSGSSATNASDSIFLGNSSGNNGTGDNHSIFVGDSAGQNDPTANNSIFIGYGAGNGDTTLDNSTGETSILVGQNSSTGNFSDSACIGASCTNTAAFQFLVSSHGFHPFTDIALDSSTGTFRAGDLTNAGNGTSLTVDDGGTAIQNVISGYYNIKNTAGHRIFLTNTFGTNFAAYIGDFDGFENKTLETVDDLNQIINFQNEGVTSFTDIYGNPFIKLDVGGGTLQLGNTSLWGANIAINNGASTVTIGDTTANNNGTIFQVDDATQSYNFDKLNFNIGGVSTVAPSANAVGFLANDGSGNESWIPAMTGISIGDAISSGTANSILYEDNSGNLAEDSLFTRSSVSNDTVIDRDAGTSQDAGLEESSNVGGLGINGAGLIYHNSATQTSFLVTGSLGGQPITAEGYSDTVANISNLLDSDTTGFHIQANNNGTSTGIDVMDDEINIDKNGSPSYILTTDPGTSGQVIENDGAGGTAWDTLNFNQLGGIPTTLAGYGITDALSSNGLKGTSGTPTIVAGSGAGTSPTVSVQGTNIGGLVNVTTGTGVTLPSGATIFTVTYNGLTFPTDSYVTLTPANAATALLSGATMIYVSGNTVSFSGISGTTGINPITTYSWNYEVVGN